MMSGVTLRQPSLNEAYHPALVSISGQSKISLVLPHLTADSLKVCCCLPLKQRECKSSQHICHAEALTSISLGSATWLQSISAGPFQHDKMSTKWGKDKDKKKKEKKRASYLRERGEGMSITEAPDMTVASSSPWCCCGRQRKTSLGETGDTKGGYDMRWTKKRRDGGLQETCICRYR